MPMASPDQTKVNDDFFSKVMLCRQTFMHLIW